MVEFQNPPIITVSGDAEEPPPKPKEVTVAELVEALRALPQDLPVYACDDSLWYAPKPQIETLGQETVVILVGDDR